MRAEPDAGLRKGSLPFLKDTAYAVKGCSLTLKPFNSPVHHGTIEIPQQNVVIVGMQRPVRRKRASPDIHELFKLRIRLGQHIGVFRVQQVKALAQMKNRAQNCGGFQSASFLLTLSPLQRTGRTVLPEVDAITKPVIGLRKGLELSTF